MSGAQYLKTLFAVVLILGLTIGGGLLHGRLTDRWGPPPQMIAAAEMLPRIPDHFGNWRQVATRELDSLSIEMLQCAGYIDRSYQNRVTGAQVDVLVLLGPTGPIAMHTPEVCVSTKAYKTRDDRHRVEIPGDAGSSPSFWSLDFVSSGVSDNVMRCYYAWNDGGIWESPANARFHYVGKPYLYKIQLFSEVGTSGRSSAKDPARQFLEDFLPVAAPLLKRPQ